MFMRRSTLALAVAAFTIAPFPLMASEADALAIDAAIVARHMPFGTILKLQNVTVAINGMSVLVLYAGPTPNFVGLDQINVSLPIALQGAGLTNVTVTVDGQTSNAVTIQVQ
jgi:uncharacterized protein (TIGR03437 family)